MGTEKATHLFSCQLFWNELVRQGMIAGRGLYGLIIIRGVLEIDLK